jgi:hypothetical protein
MQSADLSAIVCWCHFTGVPTHDCRITVLLAGRDQPVTKVLLKLKDNQDVRQAVVGKSDWR